MNSDQHYPIHASKYLFIYYWSRQTIKFALISTHKWCNWTTYRIILYTSYAHFNLSNGWFNHWIYCPAIYFWVPCHIFLILVLLPCSPVCVTAGMATLVNTTIHEMPAEELCSELQIESCIWSNSSPNSHYISN